jgi:hypothetical protein
MGWGFQLLDHAHMQGAISVPDWDMCQSSHNAAHLHATARAVSGK